MKVRRGLLAGLAAFVAIPLVIGVTSVVRFGNSDRICSGVTISGVAVGGLPKSAAGQALRSWAKDRLTREITLTALDTRWSGTAAAFGTRIDWKAAVDKAYAIGREGSFISRALCISSGPHGKQIKMPVVMNQVVLEKTLAKVGKSVNKPHRDARLRVAKDHLVIDSDSCGIKLDEGKAAKIISDAVESGLQVVPLPIVIDRPDVLADAARGINSLLSRYTTPFNPGNRGRTHNLTLAASAISGVILKPGSEFSYNDTVGPRVTERGYQNAIVFVRGKMEPGIGGGICQVSSTLYNTVLLAGLDVTARRPHSRTVPYVIPGRDATVAYGQQDFRFKNSNTSPVGLIATIRGAHLTIDIYGSRKDKKTVAVYTSSPKYIPHGEQTILDTKLAPGARRVVDKGSSGVSVIVYRRITDPSGKSTTEVISRDKYPVQARVIAIGSRSSAVSTIPSTTDGKTASVASRT